MYDENSVQIPQALPEQNPTSKPRSLSKAYDLLTTRHSSTREGDRDYSRAQILQTYVYGHQRQDPKGDPDVSVYSLDSIAHARMRRSIVVNDKDNAVITVNPRVPIETPAPTAAVAPTNTKKKKKEQLAKKRARSAANA